MKMIQIYVRLLDEGTDVFRPTFATQQANSCYLLLPTPDYDQEDETWEFKPGDVVRCKKKLLAGGIRLVAECKVLPE
jgi:hypothetical protein